MSSSWIIVSAPAEVQNLSAIMSEELTQCLRIEEIKFAEEISDQNESFSNDTPPKLLKPIEEASYCGYCDSDAVIAKVLQCQFDEEYAEIVKRVKKKKSGDAKISVSYKYYWDVPDHLVYDSDPDDEDLDKDIVINSNRNTCRVTAFPSKTSIGDRAGFKFLMEQVKHQQTRKNRKLDHQVSHAIAQMGLDEPARLILFKLINNGILKDINGVISTGKKSVILHAIGDTSFPDFTVHKECAVKIFKERKYRHRYIEADYRFKDRYLKQDPRNVVLMWAEKAMHNMKRLQKIGLNCPDVICLKKNIMVMSFIGSDKKPGLTLKELMLKQEKWPNVYNAVVDAMHKMYNVGHLVHANLSEYSILWWDNKCWFIDVSQSVQPDHPRALEFLLSDCRSIANFFRKKEVPAVKSAEDLFKSITGFEEVDVNMLKSVHVTYNSLSARFEIALDDNRNTSYPFKLVKIEKSGDDDDDEDKFEEVWMHSIKTMEVDNAADLDEAIKVEAPPGTSP